MIAARKAVLTEPYDNRPPCHYGGHCMDGCDVGAIFTVPDSMLPKAQKTGNFTLIPNQVAREVLVDNGAKVRGVSLVDSVTKTEQEIQARSVAVCCGAVESPRLLLNSRSPRFPNGLANSSDAVGRHLSGHVTAGVFGYLEELVGTPPMNNDGATDHSYIPRFNLNRKPLDYAGGFQYQLQDMSLCTHFMRIIATASAMPSKGRCASFSPVSSGWIALGRCWADRRTGSPRIPPTPTTTAFLIRLFIFALARTTARYGKI